MTESDVNAILVQLAEFRATVTTQLAGIASDNARGEGVHQDHETRLRRLEAGHSEGRGVWRLLTAGGAIGAAVVGVGAIVLRSFGA